MELRLPRDADRRQRRCRNSEDDRERGTDDRDDRRPGQVDGDEPAPRHAECGQLGVVVGLGAQHARDVQPDEQHGRDSRECREDQQRNRGDVDASLYGGCRIMDRRPGAHLHAVTRNG